MHLLLIMIFVKTWQKNENENNGIYHCTKMKLFLGGQGRGDEGSVGCDTSPDLNFVGKIHTYSNLSANYRFDEIEYTFPEFIFPNHVSHENKAILRKSK